MAGQVAMPQWGDVPCSKDPEVLLTLHERGSECDTQTCNAVLPDDALQSCSWSVLLAQTRVAIGAVLWHL